MDNAIWQLLLIAGIFFGVVAYSMRDYIRAYIKGMTYREFLAYEKERLKRECEKFDIEQEARKNQNFLTKYRDDFGGGLKKSVFLVVGTVALTSVTSIGLDTIGLIEFEVSLKYLLISAIGPLLLIGLAYLIKRKYPGDGK